MSFTELPALACSRVLLLEHDFEDFPYSPGGSGFLVLYRACLFLVTASHCLDNNKADATSVCIPDGSGGRDFLTFDRLSRVQADHSDDSDFADLGILRIRANTISGNQLRNLRPFPISERTIVMPEDPAIQAMVTRGYPKELNPVDYDNHRIAQRALTVVGEYDGPDTDQSHIWVMRYGKPGQRLPGTTGDGMSGSPVFAVIPNARNSVRFAGTVIRGGHTSGLWRVVSPCVLWSALRNLEQRGEVIPLSTDLVATLTEFAERR